MFVQALFFRSSSIYDAVVGTSAGLLGMLPKGLYLLISISLAAGIVTLSKKKVLVQDLYSLENLAHVDVLCLDKTGTLTEGRMKVEKAVLAGDTDASQFGRLIGNFLSNTQDNNATFQAMHDYFPQEDSLSVSSHIPFSSERKWSCMTFSGVGTFIIGAPEKLYNGKLPEEIEQSQRCGKRVLLAGITQEEVEKDKPLPYVKVIAGIILTDPIRQNAEKTISEFQNEGVAVKVISGDNPLTAFAVAVQAGIYHGDCWVDMSTIDDSQIDTVAEKYSVFGRVTPQQKRQLVQAFHRSNHTVAMTGDGVNDLLALKEADCSIAVGQGSDAARQTAQLVLLESDFSVLKDVLMEGRRVVHNVTRSAGVFFIKTIYSVLLCIICLITNMPFPFVPVQITLIDLIIEGYPSFFLSFQKDSRPVNTRFLPEALRRAAPNAIAIAICFVAYQILHICGFIGLPGEQTQANALLFLLIGTVGLMGVFKMCKPFDIIKMFFAVTSAVGFYTAVALCLYLQNHILNIDILLEGVANTPERRQKYMKTILTKANDIDRIVDKLFLFSKLDLGDSPFYPESLSVAETIKSLLSSNADEYAKHGMTITTDDIPPECTVCADPVQFRNAVTNLLENSLKYKDSQEVHVHISCTENERDVTISVEDDGPGVPEDALPKLFDVFYRSDPSRSNPQKGSGLGLAITAKILERFGGSVRAENCKPKGLRILLTIPKGESGI